MRIKKDVHCQVKNMSHLKIMVLKSYLVLDSNYGIPHNISLILDDRNYSIIEIGTSRRIPIPIVL